MNPDTYWEENKQLRASGKIAEAVVNATEWIKLLPKDANAWWALTHSQKAAKNYAEALSAVKETIRLAPKWATGWAEYGAILELNGQVDEAINAHKKALDLDHNHDHSHFQLSRIYENRKEKDKRIPHLEFLESKGKLSATAINSLGVLHWENEKTLAALHYFQKAAKKGPDKYSLYNQYLAYQKKEVGQLIDAYDSLMEALEIDPSYELAKESLQKVIDRIKMEIGIVDPNPLTPLKLEDWFQYYINPFELIGYKENDNKVDIYDVRSIQKAKKAILQEIELEDGIVESLQGFQITKTKAIEVIEELNNEIFFDYHFGVFQNKELLYFLTRGDIRFFSLRHNEYPKKIIAAHRGDGFAEWISERFINQFELVLGKTCEARNAGNLRRLLSGRRIVPKNDEFKCFNKAQRILSALIEPVKEISDKAEKEKPSAVKIKEILNDEILKVYLSESRTFFNKEVDQLIMWIRSAAIDTNNEFHDREESICILKIALDITTPNSSIAAKLAQDIKDVTGFLNDDNKYEAKLSSGEIPWHITRKTVTKGDVTFQIEDIDGVRIGHTIIQSNPTVLIKHLVAFESRGREIVFGWNAEPSQKQKSAFDKLTTATFNYVLPKVTKKIHERIQKGETIPLGDMTLDSRGWRYEKQSFFSSKTILILWSQMLADIKNGDLLISDRLTGEKAPNKTIADVTNALIVPNLANVINENN
jgi:tetratricopeptide (TPR) repeat protein